MVVDDRQRLEVLEVAAAVGGLVHGTVRELVLPAADAGMTAEAVLTAVGDEDVVVAVLAAEDDPRAASWRVMRAAGKPLVLVPPRLRDGHPPIGRVLVPLDGTPECAHAVEHTIELCTHAGVDLVVLHVFGPSTMPPYWDQPAHALQAWSEEFLSRHVAAPGVRLEVRTGVPGDNVVDVAASLGADLIALGWSQRLDAGRARTVRRAVAEAPVPVMLVPVHDDAGSDAAAPRGRSALPAPDDQRLS